MRQKKLLSLVLTVALVLGCVTIPTSGVFAAESVDAGTTMKAQAVKSGKIASGGGTFKWTLDNAGTLKITGKGYLALRLEDLKTIRSDVKKIEISSGITDVTFSLFDFGGNQGGLPELKALSLPSTVKSLNGSLRDCTNLESISGGQNVKTIEANFFRDTKWIEKAGVRTLGKVLVSYNGTESNITIPSGIIAIEDNAFAGNRALQSVTIPTSVTTIGTYAFGQCASLTTIKGGDNVTTIGYRALYGTPWLEAQSEAAVLGKVLVKYNGLATAYTVPATIKSICDEAFAECKTLESVVINGSVKTVPDFAFRGCENLKSITMPKSVTTIAYGAFDHCKSLASVKLPASLKTIETGAFIFCSTLKSVQVNGGQTNTKLKSIGGKAFAACDDLKQLTIPWGLTEMGAFAYGYTNDKKSEWSIISDELLKVKGTTITGIKQSYGNWYAKDNGIAFKGTAKGSALKKPTLTKKGKGNNLTLKFSKVSGATGYEVYSKSDYEGSTWNKYATATAKKASVTVYSYPGTKYKVRAYRKSKTGGYQYSEFSKVLTCK